MQTLLSLSQIEDLNLLFIHMHHLINEFRPHQARETLRVMLHVQRRKRAQVAERFQLHMDKVQETIEEALRSLPEQPEAEDKLLLVSRRVAEIEHPSSSAGEGAPPRALDLQSSCSTEDHLLCQVADRTHAEAEADRMEGGRAEA